MTRIVLLNVKYSPNLGDGLLSECLERELEENLSVGSSVTSVDLAGRSSYSMTKGRTRARVMAVLVRLPERLRNVASGFMLNALVLTKLNRHFRTGLEKADVAIVGGGNLFTDADLNFPIKIAAALKRARRAGIPVLVHAVGVSPKWSAKGRALFVGALKSSRLVSASVRDEQSRAAWERHFSADGVPASYVVVDPGVLASRHYPRSAKKPGDRTIGFCITDPVAVHYHSDDRGPADLDEWYPKAIASLVDRGFEVCLFTNGSPEDGAYLWDNAPRWVQRAKGPVTINRSFATPSDLAAFVSSCTAIIGHRMHACIAAYSFGVPAVGLTWDVKMESFFELAGRRDYLVDPGVQRAEEIGQWVATAIADRFDPTPLIGRARSEIAELATRLEDHRIVRRHA